MGIDWQGCRVFVTGATGLVGSWLVKELIRRGASVTTLIRRRPSNSVFYLDGLDGSCDLVYGSITDLDALRQVINERDIEVVFHLAAVSTVGAAYRSPLDAFDVNVRGTWSVLEACRGLSKSPLRRVIVASSDKAYGDQGRISYTEDMQPRVQFPYETSKACADIIAHCYYESYNLPVVITRCGNVYGGGDTNFNRIIPGAIQAIRAGEPPVLRSDGTQVRDYVYIQDIVDAYLLLAEADKSKVVGKAFNVAGPLEYTVLDVVTALLRIMGSKLKPVVLNGTFGEIPYQHLSGERLFETLGWRPQFSLDEGLRKTVDWYNAYAR